MCNWRSIWRKWKSRDDLSMMDKANSSAPDFSFYVCPQCRGTLAVAGATLHCSACRHNYPVQHGIPDFISEDLTQSTNPVLRQVKWLDLLARVYESKVWYPVVLRLFAGRGQLSFAGLINLVQEMIGPVNGVVLDVACGPGTYGRRIASLSRRVYGIDISRGMLEQGAAYARREGVSNVQFSRAQVETLPFRDAVFDAAICSGSLHLFQDAGRALAEIGRTLKPGAPLAIVTFTAGREGLFRFPRVLQWARSRGGHVFSVSELESLLKENGFAGYKSTVYGSLLTCRAQKS